MAYLLSIIPKAKWYSPTILMNTNSLLMDVEEIDAYIEKYAIGWRPERITRTAAAVLRCALAELLYVEDTPPSAAINAAVELAKSYEEPETVSFINGVLGGFMRGERAGAPEET